MSPWAGDFAGFLASDQPAQMGLSSTSSGPPPQWLDAPSQYAGTPGTEHRGIGARERECLDFWTSCHHSHMELPQYRAEG